ncbi:MAG: glycosyltransferase family 4 protein [Candidatus Omnitrophica bacterium]|nr:glycosyltransferase family 4 protein [Candidatus Omnitrophota bacterium]
MNIMSNNTRPKVLVCGVLPPPYFGHSVMYKMLMDSSFPAEVQVRFFNMNFWSYQTDKKVTVKKIFKMLKYYFRYVATIVFWRPRYVLYNSSFYRMPFLKDFLFCATGIALGCRVVFHDFGQYVRELHDTLPPWQRIMLRWMLRNAAGSIVMGESVRAAYKGLMDNKKIFVVPGVVENTRDWDVRPNRLANGLLNILYFSHMSKLKGIFVAFEAAEKILCARSNVAITFAGPIENEEVTFRLEELRKEHPGRVNYMGYVEDVRERTAIFRGADVFMFTTLRDVFGLVLLHAMAEGVPIVASREGTIPEIIPDERYGILFEKGDAQALAEKVLTLVVDEGRRKTMGASNRTRFEQNYCLEVYGRRMQDAFRALGFLGQRGRQC